MPNPNSQPVEINRPMKKVTTNFSDINYDQDPQQRRLTEYGPDETPRQHPPSQQQGMLAPSLGQGQPYGQNHSYDPMSAASPGFGSGIGAGAPENVAYPYQGRGIDQSDPNQNRPGFNDDPDATNALKPYQTTDAGDWDDDNYHSQGQYQDQGQDYQASNQNSNPTPNNYSSGVPNQSQQHYPHDSGAGAGAGAGSGYARDPTSSQAKDDFADDNDPANPMNQESRYNRVQNHQQHGYNGNDGDDGGDENMDPSGGDYHDDGYGNDDNENKKSWLGQKYASYQAAKQGPGISDDDLKKYTGKDRAEFDEWAAQQPGVGGRQAAMDPRSAAEGSYGS